MSITRLPMFFAVSMLVVALAGLAQAQTTLRVDDDASSNGDGTTWAKAFMYLQDALDHASTSGVDEIHVAGGTYWPDRDERGNVTLDDRGATFELLDGVSIMGGYAGLADLGAPDVRNVDSNASILSGDINVPGLETDNSCHVVTASGVGIMTVLDGFTITAGYAGGSCSLDAGGGMYITSTSSPIIYQCTFSGNWAFLYGGGIFNTGSSSPGLAECEFADNEAQDGGGMYNDWSTGPALVDCAFNSNGASGRGGGMANNPYSTPDLINCTFRENTSGLRGGGMNNYTSSPTLTECTFTRNRITELNTDLCGGGGMLNEGSSDPVLTACVFSGNSATKSGGAVHNFGNATDPTLINCIFSGNSAGDYGGGMYTNKKCFPTLTNCTFAGNTAVKGGRALACANTYLGEVNESHVEVVSGILWNGGDEVWNTNGSTTMVTYSDVQGGHLGAGNIDADPQLADLNGPDGTPGTGDEDFHLLSGSPCVNTGSNYAPVLPLWDFENEPRKQQCRVDMGADESPHSPDPPPDCNSNGYPDDCDVDAGTSPDCNSNHIPDDCEPDCNSNGVPDDCDIAGSTSDDCNSNGIPDECIELEEDCNGNAVPDACDIAGATSEDCQANNVPDECDLAGGTSDDCNANTIPDECDIATGTSDDCNTNGIPDECMPPELDCNANDVPDDCDIAAGTSEDLNTNGIPDECQCSANELAKLLASDGVWADSFGYSVAIVDDTAVIGAPDAGTNGLLQCGAAYVFVNGGGTWAQQGKLLAGDRAAWDFFGRAVGISGDRPGRVLVGAEWAQTNGLSGLGAAYVFVNSNGTWTQEAKLLASDGAANDHFGHSVAISGDTAVISARNARTNGLADVGAAYVFVNSSGIWSQQAKLLPEPLSAGDYFGSSIVIDADPSLRVVIGSTRAAYAWINSNGTWHQEAKLLPFDGNPWGRRFGSSVAIADETVVVGAPEEDDSGEDSGAAYVFINSSGTWSPQAKLLASGGAEDDYFGTSLAIEGDTAVIGAFRDDDNGESSGSAYVFRRDGSTWREQAKLTASDGAAWNQFGGAVGLSGDTAVIGARNADGLVSDSGAAYVFRGISDCNGTGLVDICDIAHGDSADCNSNSVPDECSPPELDCNGNSVPDECDLAGGTSEDLDGDGFPDECGFTVYVDDDAPGGGDGLSWETALSDLQDALTLASSNALVAEVRVAAGKYVPTRRSEQETARTETFELVDGVALRGGYRGCPGGSCGGADPDDRDFVTWKSVLSGDLTGNDVGTSGVGENSFHVVIAEDVSSNAVLDGFTITRGNADHPSDIGHKLGGGLVNVDGDLTLANCTFSGNSVCDCGGGMWNENGNPTLTNCTFSGNLAGNNGGGMNGYGSPTLAACTFSGNSAGAQGGGMASYGSPTLTNCTFSGNLAGAGGFGGGGMNGYFGDLRLTNCTFSGNSAASGAGGGLRALQCDLTLTNCTFAANSAFSGGGGIFINQSTLVVTNSILWDNSPGQIESYLSSITASHSCIEDGGGEPWFSKTCIDDDPLFVRNPDAGSNGWDGMDDDYGDLRLRLGSPCIDVGDNTKLPIEVTTDLDGNPRFVDDPFTNSNGYPPGADAYVDMGAYERQTIIFVDWYRPGSSDESGSSWENAFKELYDALDWVDSNGIAGEIWVAAGTYLPNTNGLADPREATFQLINGVRVYGGFWGDEDPTTFDLGDRNTELYETILSGDIPGDNAYHVVTGSGTDATAMLDGFTITAGSANGANPDDTGGGMYNNAGSPTVVHCTFTDNSAAYGGGLGNTNASSPTLSECTFNENSASTYGGAVSNYSNCSPTMTDCLFAGNSAGSSGGAVRTYTGAPRLTNCVFSGNYSINYNGGAMYNHECALTLTNCTFSINMANAAVGEGGGLFNNNSDPLVVNCIFWGNIDGGGTDESAQIHGGTPTVAFSCIQDDIPDDGTIPFGGEDNYNIDTNPLFVPGPAGCYYLSQTAAGQMQDSPCVGAGSDTAANMDLDTLTTRTDEVEDTGIVDMGYHYLVTATSFVWGDFDRDGDIDLDDYAEFNVCITGPCESPPCSPRPYTDPCCAIGDFDTDGDVDLFDVAEFQVSFTDS